MYVIVENNQVTLGPMGWNSRMFASHLEDQYETSFTIPRVDPQGPYIVDDDIKILPVTMTEPSYDNRIQQLAGPFYTIAADSAVGTYNVVAKPLDAIKNGQKAVVAANRYKYEVRGIKVTLQGSDYSVSTARGDRDIYLQALQLNASGHSWKFPEGWVVLDSTELQTIVQAIMTHVQEQFAWEAQQVALIDMGTTAYEVIDIDVVRSEFEPQAPGVE